MYNLCKYCASDAGDRVDQYGESVCQSCDTFFDENPTPPVSPVTDNVEQYGSDHCWRCGHYSGYGNSWCGEC